MNKMATKLQKKKEADALSGIDALSGTQTNDETDCFADIVERIRQPELSLRAMAMAMNPTIKTEKRPLPPELEANLDRKDFIQWKKSTKM